jgi:hypothetical protein
VSRGELKGVTESEIISPQDQAFKTRYLATKILQTGTDSKCTLCQQYDQTINHIISARPILLREQYIKRRDTVRAELHFNMSKEKWGKSDNKQWYDHVPKSVETSHEGKVTVIWNQQCVPTELLLTINQTS